MYINSVILTLHIESVEIIQMLCNLQMGSVIENSTVQIIQTIVQYVKFCTVELYSSVRLPNTYVHILVITKFRSIFA